MVSSLLLDPQHGCVIFSELAKKPISIYSIIYTTGSFNFFSFLTLKLCRQNLGIIYLLSHEVNTFRQIKGKTNRKHFTKQLICLLTIQRHYFCLLWTNTNNLFLTSKLHFNCSVTIYFHLNMERGTASNKIFDSQGVLCPIPFKHS